MQKLKSSSVALTAIAVGVALGVASIAPSDAAEMQGALVRGGKLYDKWFAVIKAPTPKGTHKAWPASNTKKKGNATWR